MSELTFLNCFNDDFFTNQKTNEHFPQIILNTNAFYSNYYLTDEIVSLNEYMIKYHCPLLIAFRIQSPNQFTCKNEICQIVQDFFLVSRYTLRRDRTSQRNKITFVCECRSKKKWPKDSNCINGINTENSIDINNNDDIEVKTSKPRVKEIKRKNKEGCNYRLKFNFDQSNFVFTFDKSSVLNHNHPPQTHLSIEQFKCRQKNIKFSFQMVINLFKTMIESRKKLTKDVMKNIKKEYMQKYNLLEGKSTQKKRVIINKLTQLMKSIQVYLNKAISIQKDLDSLSDDVILHSLAKVFIKKNASCYLRLESIEEIIKLIDLY